MGRELGIHRIDFLSNGKAIIRHNDYNLCGRTDFTNAITNLFYHVGDEQVCYLLVNTHNMPLVGNEKEPFKVTVTTEDPYWDEKEFTLEYYYVDYNTIKRITDEHIEEDKRELERCDKIMEDARLARQHAADLQTFNDFSELIDELADHIFNYCEEALDYITTIEEILPVLDCANDSNGEPTVTNSFVLLTYSE